MRAPMSMVRPNSAVKILQNPANGPTTSIVTFAASLREIFSLSGGISNFRLARSRHHQRLPFAGAANRKIVGHGTTARAPDEEAPAPKLGNRAGQRPARSALHAGAPKSATSRGSPINSPPNNNRCKRTWASAAGMPNRSGRSSHRGASG